MIYLASPYNHHIPAVRHDRFVLVSQLATKMMKEGKLVYCPIAYGHQFREVFDNQADRWAYWRSFDLRILCHCEQMVVYMLPGWKESVGVAEEINYAKYRGIPIHFMEYRS